VAHATKDESNNGQSDNTRAAFPDIGLNRSTNSTLSNFSLTDVSTSEDVLSDNSNISQNNKTEPTITDENTTPPEENNTVPQEPTTTPAENVTTSKQLNNTNNNTSESNVTTTSAVPVDGVDIVNSESNTAADQALPAEQQPANNITSSNTTAAITAT